jgi:triosephosphate isomerase
MCCKEFRIIVFYGGSITKQKLDKLSEKKILDGRRRAGIFLQIFLPVKWQQRTL